MANKNNSESCTSYWIYILTCENNSYYTGYTTDLTRRFQEHLDGTAKCKYTRGFKPTGIAQSWKTSDKITAMQIEKYIKTISKEQKRQLISNPKLLLQLFECKVDSR